MADTFVCEHCGAEQDYEFDVDGIRVSAALFVRLVREADLPAVCPDCAELLFTSDKLTYDS